MGESSEQDEAAPAWRAIEPKLELAERGRRERARRGPKRRSLVARDPGVPFWTPSGKAWDEMPEELKRAVLDLLTPAYQRLVVEVDDELERSAGMTLVHLMWLEVCDQLHLAETVPDPLSILAVVRDPEQMIARHLHLVGSKNAVSELLLRLRMVRAMLAQGQGCGGREARLAATKVKALGVEEHEIAQSPS